MPLTGPQIKRIASTITEAYTRDELRRAVKIEMNVDFDGIVPNVGFEMQVFDFVDWANRQNRALELLRCAVDHNGSNTSLAILWRELGGQGQGSAANEFPDESTVDETWPSASQIEWIDILAGEFWMGSDPAVDGFAFLDEEPQHRLFLPTFRSAKYPVTNAQYLMFVQMAHYSAPAHWENGKPPPGKEHYPVVNVSWHDAVAFCRWASNQHKCSVTLPSEAEWEKAARGPDGLLWPWGNIPPTPAICNFNNTQPGTTVVNRYQGGVSSLGVMDTAGNVWEWTRSLWGTDTEHAEFRYPYQPGDGREALVASSDVHRVLRGGSFNNQAQGVRCAYRGWCPPYFANLDIGFRVVADPPIDRTSAGASF